MSDAMQVALSGSRLGRIVLHLLVMAHSRHCKSHFAGILREITLH